MNLLSRFTLIKYYSCLAVIIAFIHLNAAAQTTSKDNERNFKLYQASADKAYHTSNIYYIAYFEKTLPPSAKVIRRLDDRTAIVEINSEQSFRSVSMEARLALANDNWKLSPSLEINIDKIRE